ncbi:Rossmann-like and DUF2520 domain-containing protein [Tenacibaculum piscium]|uniref:DUF2520 domain-containing protein n=1 Tax=Tenacibaculum piscium TaxID=1458515 RepID=A0A2H1YEN3_9FLAO|nr:DUF2520 domain-containing protein [Tenacibaculum piscium]MBE7628369.1 DUF2520 domain-containing protein [Tenacibaculum piscium]MBE7669526.1 DUF2520 domain-containing protein [Tenacibaculum piscium]MBE7686323.1 DUF2520 domain-containing protein [Tenacibaculum piscium]MBE7689516.1 DUF2520 domain-containing protein [Tenacibaculum piscium]SOS73959.1 conserved hypothetical protein [Tenacibaculum piscium]
MIKIVIIGGGNVAIHLANAFYKTKKVLLTQMYARNIQQIIHLKERVAITDNINLLADADIYIIAVSDDAISEVSSKINKQNSLVVHTSGSVSLNSLQNNGRKGVFYLLQSFSKDKKINFDEIPFCLEAQNNDDFKLLESVAKSIGKKTYPISSQQRKTLHVAAVFVNNFTNHLYKIGDDICKEHRVPFEILHPLIEETALKIQKLSPEKAQTGPAKRNDTQTIANHLELLNKEQQTIYQLITSSIQNSIQDSIQK